MNKRNFGRVIARIEKHKDLWRQSRPPQGLKNECGAPYCFIGHAEFLRTGGKRTTRTTVEGWKAPAITSRALQKWLGLTQNEMYEVYLGSNTLKDLKRWHKKGKIE